jgi:hypothetical protein
VVDATRQEQARAILERRARRLASSILGRRASTAADFREAFTLERIDLVTEINDHETLLAVGRNRVGPRDGLYVIEEGATYSVYIQERGVPVAGGRGLDFEEAREVAADLAIRMNGIPFDL